MKNLEFDNDEKMKHIEEDIKRVQEVNQIIREAMFAKQEIFHRIVNG